MTPSGVVQAGEARILQTHLTCSIPLPHPLVRAPSGSVPFPWLRPDRAFLRV